MKRINTENKNIINIVDTETRNLCLSAFYAQHVPNHTSSRTVCMHLKKDIVPHIISINRCKPTVKLCQPQTAIDVLFSVTQL